jgi:threonine synthase
LEAGAGFAVNPHWLGWRCVVCGRQHPPGHAGFTCARCGPDGVLDAVYDYPAIARGLDRADPFPAGNAAPGAAGSAASGAPTGAPARPDLWRFAPLLPLRPLAPHAAWSLGDTPLHAPSRLRAALGLPGLWLKDDTGLPSASLKDRAAALAIAHATQIGAAHLACASTGNAAASLAVLAARTGLPATIFVPAAAPAAKLAQLVVHGAEVVRVDGPYDEAFDLSLREISAHGWYSRNCAHNPILVEGKKTAALEVALALGAAAGDGVRGGGGGGGGASAPGVPALLAAPDAVFVPVGDGCIVSSTGKAFAELEAVGLLARRPRVYGVQAQGAAPLARAWETAGGAAAAAALDGPAILKTVAPVIARTIADSISVGVPRNRVKAWRQVAASGGGFLSVPDEAILEAIRLLARLAGVWAEPSAAAALAGAIAARDAGLIRPGETVVAMITGHGLKDPLKGIPA